MSADSEHSSNPDSINKPESSVNGGRDLIRPETGAVCGVTWLLATLIGLIVGLAVERPGAWLVGMILGTGAVILLYGLMLLSAVFVTKFRLAILTDYAADRRGTVALFAIVVIACGVGTFFLAFHELESAQTLHDALQETEESDLD